MARERKPTDPQARAIFEIHRRYIEVMEQRLSMVEEQTRTNYVAVMT
jgi:beta-galactosidase beta subunit